MKSGRAYEVTENPLHPKRRTVKLGSAGLGSATYKLWDLGKSLDHVEPQSPHL